MAEPLPPPRPAAPADAAGQGLPLCDGRALEEAGRAHVWDVLEYGRPARAFVLRFEGELRGFMNRCLHVPTEMDWQPGEFLDSDRRWILCSLHGATYDPRDGRCVGGPCGRGKLRPVAVAEVGGQVHWYPSADIQPVPVPTPAPPPAPHPAPDTAAAPAPDTGPTP